MLIAQTSDWSALHKPAGMPLYSDDRIQADTTVLSWLKAHDIPQHFAHRLDRATSGILLVCHSSNAAAEIQKQFRAGRIRKQYLAMCRGRAPHQAIIRTPLLRLDSRNTTRTLRDQPAQSAWTTARRLAHTTLDDADPRGLRRHYSLVLVQTRTGRRHQIRRHFKRIHHPLIGDTTWGKGDHNRYFRVRFDCHRLLLHATTLAFNDPGTGVRHTLTCKLSGQYSDTVSQLGWHKACRPWLESFSP